MQRIELNIELWLPLATAHGFIRLAVDTLYLVCDNLLLCVMCVSLLLLSLLCFHFNFNFVYNVSRICVCEGRAHDITPLG